MHVLQFASCVRQARACEGGASGRTVKGARGARGLASMKILARPRSALAARRGRRSSGAAHDGERGRHAMPLYGEAGALTSERQRATAWSEALTTRLTRLSSIAPGWAAAPLARRPLYLLIRLEIALEVRCSDPSTPYPMQGVGSEVVRKIIE